LFLSLNPLLKEKIGFSPKMVQPVSQPSSAQSVAKYVQADAINFSLAMNGKIGNMSNVRSPKNNREIP